MSDWKPFLKIGSFEAHYKEAGLLAFVFDKNKKWCLHLFVKPTHWVWGHKTEDYDQCAEYYGFGPLFLLVKGNV